MGGTLVSQVYNRQMIACLVDETGDTLNRELNLLAQYALNRSEDATRLQWFERDDKVDRGLGPGFHVLRHVELRECDPLHPPFEDATQIGEESILIGTVQWCRSGDRFEVRSMIVDTARTRKAPDP